MFKEAEKGDKEVFLERMDDVTETKCDIVVTACPFCMTMLTDGIKYTNQEESMKNFDVAELVAQALGIQSLKSLKLGSYELRVKSWKVGKLES